MDRCRTRGGRTRRVRLPALALVTVAGLAVGCSSSAGDTGTSSPATPTMPTTPTSAPTTAPSTAGDTRTPVASPTAQATVVHRKVSKPPGAKDPGFTACGAGENFTLGIMRTMFTGGSVESQLALQPAMGSSARVARQHTLSARKTWIAKGWPAGSTLVRDIDRMADLFQQTDKAAGAGDLEAYPGLYVAIDSAQKQFSADLDSAGVCQQ